MRKKRRRDTGNAYYSDWAKKYRSKITHDISTGEHFKEKSKRYESPNGKYYLEIHPVLVRKNNRTYTYTVGKLCRKNGDQLARFERDDEKFPFHFLEEHPDGNDYLVLSENIMTYTIVCLSSENRWRIDFIPETIQKTEEEGVDGSWLSWRRFFPSPDKKTLAVEGIAFNYSGTSINQPLLSGFKEIHFLNFSNPMGEFPKRETGDRITSNFEEFLRWEDDDHVVVSVLEERRLSDLQKVDSLDSDERIAAIESNDIGKRLVFYRFPVQQGNRQEIYSEWFTPKE